VSITDGNLKLNKQQISDYKKDHSMGYLNVDEFQNINDDINKYKVRMILSLDIRLLKWLLYGPDKAHWSDADLGSHLRYERVGSIYKRGLFYCWNNFCAVT